MDDSAIRDREYAYFHAVGFFDPEAVTLLVGLPPNESWLANEEFTVGKNKLKRPKSSWKLRSGLKDTEPMSCHVNTLLRDLSLHRSGLLEASSIAKLQIVCVGFYLQSFSWELDTEQMQRACALNIGFWFDTYHFGDVHEEITMLREELGFRSEG